ncbi:energy-coupling factor ABC transporter substrate-binding protein [Clostridium sp.]|uniref:energy-coupling factor ABC transporter substrate-binding protein n=1 Tax=Clostridium sp. TaxID=1506 RepID=UPI002FC71B47
MKKNIVLIVIALLIGIFPLLVVSGEFEGADGQAEGVIAEINPDYKPWAESIFEPASGEVESTLFAIQAAIGGGVIGFGFGRLSAKRKGENEKH